MSEPNDGVERKATFAELKIGFKNEGRRLIEVKIQAYEVVKHAIEVEALAMKMKDEAQTAPETVAEVWARAAETWARSSEAWTHAAEVLALTVEAWESAKKAAARLSTEVDRSQWVSTTSITEESIVLFNSFRFE